MYRFFAWSDDIFCECFEYSRSKLFKKTNVLNFRPPRCYFERMFRMLLRKQTNVLSEILANSGILRSWVLISETFAEFRYWQGFRSRHSSVFEATFETFAQNRIRFAENSKNSSLWKARTANQTFAKNIIRSSKNSIHSCPRNVRSDQRPRHSSKKSSDQAKARGYVGSLLLVARREKAGRR